MDRTVRAIYLFSGFHFLRFRSNKADFGVDRAISVGASPTIAYSMVAFAGAGSFFGRVLPLWAADSYGIIAIMFFVLAVSAILQLVWIACNTVASLIVFNVLYGCALRCSSYSFTHANLAQSSAVLMSCFLSTSALPVLHQS